MMRMNLKTRFLVSMFGIVLLLSAMIGLLGYYVIKTDIIDRAQRQVKMNLDAARSVYDAEIERIGNTLKLISAGNGLDSLRGKVGLDYLEAVGAEDMEGVDSEIVRGAFASGEGVGGTRIIGMERLAELNSGLVEQARVTIQFTVRARPTDKTALVGAMAKEYAVPVRGEDGRVEKVIFGGRVVNNDHKLVDRIRSLVFSNRIYDGKPVGTVTIFQDDTRIATNVVTEQGQRAIGTRVSDEVYTKVVEQGRAWNDRAFVVNTWYKTAYEPIRNIEGDIIGILYVGTLEKPFEDMARGALVMFLLIVGGATVAALAISLILAAGISRPIKNLLEATGRLSDGALGYEVATRTGVSELDRLGRAFNEMSAKLNEREQSLRISNEKLAALNKSYIDLISFVSHELKGILASAVINAYSVRDGFLGLVNFKQRKALDSITRNLDYLTAVVKKFLNLGRIEKGEMQVHKTVVNLRKDIFGSSIVSLETVALKKKMEIVNEIAADVEVKADADLLQVVANNLIGNALKYGEEKTQIVVKSREDDGKVEVEVYNEGEPISDEQRKMLFKKFSRLDTAATKSVKGTGLGLFITKQIVEVHGGRIWVESREAGNAFIFQIERGF